VIGERIQKAYARWAEQYDQDENRTRDTALAVIDRLLPPLSNRDVLELGAGTGLSTERLLGARSVVAMDFSDAMLERAKSRILASHVRFLSHDVCEPWPFAAQSFDLVTESLVLEHVAELGPIFAEAGRVLRPGGALIVLELHPYRQLAGKQARFEADDETVLVPAFVHSVSELVTAARSANFNVEQLGEWRGDARAVRGEVGAIPRVLSLLLRRA
jgi:ubiquinone/menaquinone biosynthesis C-methylase UbiE